MHAGEIAPGSVLVVEKLDRLSRQDVRFTQRWLEDICATGLSIATVSGDRVYDDESLRNNLMQTFEVLMIGKLAHDESQNKSERISDSWRRKQEKAKAGVVMTTKTPGWLRVKDDRSGLATIPERVALVNEVYEMAASGHGARAIAKSLNERPIASWGDARKSGKLIGWTPGFIGDLLASPAVEGEYHPNYRSKLRNRSQNPTMGYYDRIVDADLVARARAAVAGRSGTGGRNVHNLANLFSGLAYCGQCQGKMTLRRTPVTKADGTKRYDAFYQCSNAYNGLVCTRREFYNYAKFEPAALDAILHLALGDRYFSQPKSTVHLTIKVAELKRDVDQKRGEQANQTRNMGLVKDPTPFIAVLDAISTELAELEQALKMAEKALAEAHGAVDPQEHLRRVHEVRGSLDDPDEKIRITARRKVAEAIKGLGCRIECRVDDSEEVNRTFRMEFGGGTMIVDFDNKGQIIKRWNMLKDSRELIDDESFLPLINKVAKIWAVRGMERLGVDGAEGKVDVLLERMDRKAEETA